ncbi:Transposon Ty3-I Gag-Pol polyprotein [Vitis vinifera]|uniref:Transposon Ty3-I Gag-Pol polyprotein n=1 Tax=Vitis vinifera TaxID=29760 RepID=A0A438CSI3_VITVI|nr:Transposon Ty3-I Gag-Pol polyprotein [Vitis vinifera]
MIMRSLQPRFARHLMGFPQTDFGSLVQTLYGIEEGISRGLWADSSPSDSKGRSRDQAPGPQMLIVTRSGRVAQPPPVDRPFAGIVAREEVQREDDEILRQLRTTQARISIWSLLASSSTHRDALVRALGQIRVDTTTTPEGLIHMLTADRATCIVPSGAVCSIGQRLCLNVCPLVTVIALGFSPDDFGPSTQTVRAYDGTQRTVMGTLSTHVMIGPVSYSIVFQVLRIQSSFNLLLGRPWIHEAGAIPSSLHQKVKFIHEGRIITIQSDRDIITSSEPVLHISHSEDDLHLTGFTFDEVQVVSLEDGSRDMVPMSFDQHSSTLVLSMMRGMSYLPGYIPTEADARYMSQLRRDRVRARMSGIHLIIPSAHTPSSWPTTSLGVQSIHLTQRGLVHIPETVEIQDIQQALEVPDYDLPMDLGYGTDEMDMIGIGRIFDAVPHEPHTVFDMFGVFVFETDEDDFILDAYTDDMDFIGIGHILDAAPRGPLSAFNISGVSVLDDESVLDVVTSDFASVEGVSDSMDPPLSFDTMSGSYLDVFAWSYEDMSGLDPTIVQHHLPILPHARPVKQKLRRLHPRWSLQVKEEIQKQLSVGFLSLIEYPEWLANVVPVPKKDGKVRVCVDFRDLNKASPKDDFPLPHIDMLVDSTAGIPMLSFMDGFSGYNQILMAPEDMNAGATYQRTATTLFHDMMHRDIEAEIESQEVHLWGDFWKLLGHIVSERGIEVDPEKIRAILDMPTPRTEKEIRGFLGRLQYISRFIARLTNICEPIFRLLRKNQPTVWNDDCQHAFERIKECLLSPPVLVPPTPGRPLLLYLSVSDMALGCMLPSA